MGSHGGSRANRMRFLEEVCTAVRRQVGEGFPVTIKLTAADHLEEGFEFDEAMQAAQRMEELGIDAIEVSSGTAASGKEGPVRQGIDRPEQEAYNALNARRLKEAGGIPIMVVGGLRSRAVLQRLLRTARPTSVKFKVRFRPFSPAVPSISSVAILIQGRAGC